MTFVECDIYAHSDGALSSSSAFSKSSEPIGQSMILVFLEDITNEVYTHHLEELNAYKLRMLSSVSHELKTPLNCSMGMLEELSGFVVNCGLFDRDSQTVEYIQSLIEPA